MDRLAASAWWESWSLEQRKSAVRQQGLRVGEGPWPPEAWMWLLSSRVSKRKQRLFVCACCRAMWPRLTDERSRAAVDLAERYADGQATLDELRQTRITAFYGFRAGKTEAARAALCAVEDDVALERVSRYASQCGFQEEQRDWLRDLVGEMPAEPSVEQSWRLSNDRLVLKIAQSIYEERRFSDLPILGDALEEVGCTSQELLDHCRGSGRHIRGCYALDAVLGKK
jgi:hypothetical protein